MKNFLKLVPIAAAMVFGMTGIASATSTTAAATGWTGGPDFDLTFAGFGITESGATDFSDNFPFLMPLASAHLSAHLVFGQFYSHTIIVDHFELWDVTTNTLISSAPSLPSTSVLFDVPNAIYSLTDVYHLHIDGHLTGPHGSYAGSLNLTGTSDVTPLPEPESYALFMAGLGLMGFIARRRKNGQA
jgi:hypothetical protein